MRKTIRRWIAKRWAQAKANPYFWSWIIAVIIFTGFLNNLNFFQFKRKDPSVDRELMAFLICVVHALVTINTMILFVELMAKLPRERDVFDLKLSERRCINKLTGISLLLLVVSIFCSGATACIAIYKGVINVSTEEDWREILHVNEWLCIGIFTLFVMSGWLFKGICRTALKCRRLRGEARIAIRQFLFEIDLYAFTCDRPGLLGVVLITLIAWVLRHSNGAHAEFNDGFIAGALGLHVAFSQSILALLGFLKRKQY